MLLVFILIITYVFISGNLKQILDETFLPWLFEFYYSYKETGEFATASSDHLINQMYYSLPNETLLFGDGKYSNSDGSYYGHTDAGYMRNVLFYGVGGVIFLIIFQMKLIHNLFKNQNSPKLFLIVVFLTLLVLHIKGDVLMHTPLVSVMFGAIVLGDFKKLKEL